MNDPFVPLVLRIVSLALKHVTVSAADEQAVERLLDDPTAVGQSGFIAHAKAKGIALTPGFWVLYVRLVIGTWDEGGIAHAKWLKGLRDLYAGALDDGPRALPDRLLDHAAEVLEALAADPDADTVADLAIAFEALATECEALHDTDTAYDLLSCVLGLDTPRDAARRRIAARALALAVAAGRAHQVLVCTADLAATAVAMVGDDRAARLDAFTVVERAVERVSQAPEPIGKQVASDLYTLIKPHDWLRCLAAPLVFILEIGSAAAREELAKLLDGTTWPERISTMPQAEWVEKIGGRVQAMLWELEVERQRFELEPASTDIGATADWLDWMVTHPAYARAVPHNRSFLREAEFPQHLLVLTHETTHVFSFLGQIGACLTALRVAAQENEASLAMTRDTTRTRSPDAKLQQPFPEARVTALIPGDAGCLWRAERGIELTRKAQALQDAWTPWFEGLAMFGEMAADPALDPVGINPVTEVLRNLVDFHPTPDASGGFESEDAILREFDAFAAAFEAACSKAIAELGPGRLYAYLKTAEVPYFAGYLAVRSVVAAWRQTAQRALGGTEAFMLLLHATRYGTGEAVPDLSLRSDAFRTEAVAMMCDWVASLAALPKDAIDDFLTPGEKSDPGRAYGWMAAKPVRVANDESVWAERHQMSLRERVRQAFATLTHPDDADRLSDVDAFCKALVAQCDAVLREDAGTAAEAAMVRDGAECATHLITLGSLFPLGHVQAKFFLNRDDATDYAYLVTQLRTTESHIETGRPSVDADLFPVALGESDKLAAHYRRSGDPRLSVTRVIDLGSIAYPSRPPGGHFLAYNAGEWWHLQAPNPALDAAMRSDADHVDDLVRLVAERLVPSADAPVFHQAATPGEAGAARTRDWIDAARTWAIEGTEVPIDAWAAHVRQGAVQVLDADARRRDAREAARDLLGVLLGDQGLAEACAAPQGFDQLTRKVPSDRKALSEALFRTAQLAGDDAWLDAYAGRLGSAGVPLLVKSLLGWDVRPATGRKTSGA